MDRESLTSERDRVLSELERINSVVEPLLARREQLSRRASALTELLRPVDDSDEAYIEALRTANRMGLRRPIDPSSPRYYEPRAVREARELGVRMGRVDEEIARLRTRDAAVEAVRLRQREAEGRGRVSALPDGLVDPKGVIKDVLEDAGRPLHREEIFARSTRHPLGPINKATMVTRLSRDDDFTNVKGAPGYWALEHWPPRKQSKGAILEAGRVYAESVARLATESDRVRHLAHDAALLEQRLRRLTVDQRAYAEADPAAAERIARAVATAEAEFTKTVEQLRRGQALIASLVEAASDARAALGPEAMKYPDLPAGLSELRLEPAEADTPQAPALLGAGQPAETTSATEGGEG